MALKARFFPKHPKKYAGNPNNIVFRSSWERTFMEYCDNDPAIVTWASEELHVPYYFVGDGKWHRYFPDFLVRIRTATGLETWMVEIKPHKQTVLSRSSKPNRRQLREAVEYARNQSKWEAASAFCRKKGWKFVVLTEKDIYPALT